MSYYELIYLKKELKNKLTHGWVEQIITPFKNQLECFIACQGKRFRLVFSAAPGNVSLFLDTHRPGKKRNTIQFFEHIYGVKILGLKIPKYERYFGIEFENGYVLWFRLFGNKANAMLSYQGVIVDMFKNYEEEGSREPEDAPHTLFDTSLTNAPVLKYLQHLNPLFPKWEYEALIQAHNLNEASPDRILANLKAWSAQKEHQPAFRIVTGGRATLLNEEHLPLPTLKELESVNELISYRYKSYARNQRFQQQKRGLIKTLQRQQKRLKSSLHNLSKAQKGVEKASNYEKLGHILMAHAHLPPPDDAMVELEDFYNPGATVLIPVEAGRTMAENARHYYSRASASLASYKEATERQPRLEKREQQIRAMLEELEKLNQYHELENWKKKHKKELENFGVRKSTKQEESVPFYTFEVGGFQIWIGKNARSNDKLLQLSHKEDVWMHARGVPGSHLVIRMKNRKDFPEGSIIEKAASFAAYHSKAKGSKLVPVIVTKRKYVRKQKGGAPGAVLVQKEEVVIVKPENPMP